MLQKQGLTAIRAKMSRWKRRSYYTTLCATFEYLFLLKQLIMLHILRLTPYILAVLFVFLSTTN